jgi:hypothetical protein
MNKKVNPVGEISVSGRGSIWMVILTYSLSFLLGVNRLFHPIDLTVNISR